MISKRFGISAAVIVVSAGSLSVVAIADAGGNITGLLSVAPPPAGEVFVSIAPERVFDSREPIGITTAGPLPGGVQVDLPLTSPAPNRSTTPLPANATAAVLNVTIDNASLKAFLTIWPTGQPRPLTSANNAEPGLVSPNETVARLGSGSISMYLQQGSANLVIDLVGYYVPASPAYSFGTDAAGIALAPFSSSSLTGEFGFGPDQVVFSVPALPVGDYLLDASVAFSKAPDGTGGSTGFQNDMYPQCWWSNNVARQFNGFGYGFVPSGTYPMSVSVPGRIQAGSTADLICRYGLTDADDTVLVRDLPLDVGAVTVNVTTVTLVGTS